MSNIEGKERTVVSARVLYYNVDDNLDYEKTLLKEWGVSNLELVEVKDKEKIFYRICL
ncbi:hypothetical protein [Clostridium sp. 1001271B_151109_B4]|uniref:hypothetical protein n=1 Tax=Clostridium sp. 1001271B_151109_B4 TaxID=2787148 RepID=UPI001FAE6E08|nr:hypothetical protein [Clostridium sp. 1001271B_151109_B4]